MDAQAIAPAEVADPLEPYRRWARVLFGLLFAVGLLAGVLVLGAAGQQTSEALVLLITLALSLGVLATVYRALGRREGWSVHAIRPICYVIIASGLFRVILALTQSTFTLPLEVIGALLVLSREHGSQYLPAIADADRQRINVAVGVLVVAYVLPYLVGPVPQ